MKKIIIIGAGFAGLAVGSYLQMNGYETEIYEKHSIPGGLCTSWKRASYTFDGCIHYLVGSDKGSAFYKLWSELLELEEMEFVNHSTRVFIELKENTDKYGNKVFTLYSNVDKLERYLLDLSPEDRMPIKEFIDSIKFIQKYNLPPLIEKAPEVRNVFDRIKLITYIRVIKFLLKWNKITTMTFSERFKSKFLKEAFELLYEGQEYSVLFIAMQLAYFSSGSAGYPVGGSLALSRRLEERYYKLGGKIKFNIGVSKVITENNTAVGIQTKDNVVVHADTVISAADWNFTVFKALEGKYTDNVITSLKNQKTFEVFESALLISLGVSRAFEETPHLLRFPLDEELKLEDGSKYNRMEAHIYNYDRTMAPEGKTTITVTLTTKNADYWIELRKNNYCNYKEIKDSIAQKVVNILDNKFGNLKDKLEVVDVATPATFNRYTGNWKGSMQGWMPQNNLLSSSPVRNTLPGLKNFYMAGHWLVPGGGLPAALLSGRNLAQVICKNDKKEFFCFKPKI
ncbi:NAD(P)/FAD-dependent oxidoreductase [Clostridium sp.]|uniref:phytoene desaturase family protein n=1 Tax=Clostridium sp. TaxID=1506 RepID=UPI002631B1FF|nr:NAD(P)/FAD-dependent oxidoreductase [Clostridium sp.]